MKEIKNVLQQSGVALLLIMLLVLLSSTSILLSRFNHTDSQLARHQFTAQSLARAKAALLGFAATYAEDPDHKGQPQGYLPCPDFNGDGSSPYSASTDTSCGQQGYSMIGRLPWRTLGLPPLRDGNGECLWYAVSGSYKDRPKQILTSDDDGLFIVEDSNATLAGTTNTNRAIAIIFAAGAPITGQDRSRSGTATECGSTSMTDNVNHPRNYLDNLTLSRLAATLSNSTGTGHFSYQTAGTASGIFTTAAAADIATFVSAPQTKNSDGQIIFNDVLAVITPKDFEPVYRRMNEWVAERVTQCLVNYNAKNKTDFLNSHVDVLGNWQTPDPGTYRNFFASKIDEYVQRSVAYCKYSKCNTVQQCKQLCVEIEDECKSSCQDAACEQVCRDEMTNCQQDCGSSMVTCETNCDNNANNYRKNAIDVNTAYPWATTRVGTTGDYADEAGVRFGRIPLQLTQTLDANQQMKSVWSSLDGKTCFDTASGLDNYEWGWWSKWKEIVFYAVDDNYTPSIVTHFWLKTQNNAVKVGTKWGLDTTASSYGKESTLARLNSNAAHGWVHAGLGEIAPPAPSTNLLLNSDAANFIILNSGRKLANQPNRVDKLDITSYLEAGNQTTNDQQFERKTLNSSFNDVACRNTRADCKSIPKGDNL